MKNFIIAAIAGLIVSVGTVAFAGGCHVQQVQQVRVQRVVQQNVQQVQFVEVPHVQFVQVQHYVQPVVQQVQVQKVQVQRVQVRQPRTRSLSIQRSVTR